MLRFLAFLLCFSSISASASEKLVILSPHRKSIQQELVPVFEEYYKKTFGKEIDVEWLDQGGTSDDVRFLRAKFAKNPKGIGVDLFWGGGSAVYAELSDEKMFAPFVLKGELKKQIPAKAAGVPLYDATKTWYGSAMSSFGIFFNKRVLKFDGLSEPVSWEDLAKPEYYGNVSLTDPRRSGTSNTMNTIILQSLGWTKGWELLTSIAGNTRSFTHSSSDPIKAVVSGDAAVAMAIDFYALAKVGDLGTKNLGFSVPPTHTVLDPDPIAILNGAPNRKGAERFVEFILSPEAQNILMLPKGVKGGPKFASLGRMAVNTVSYEQTKGKRLMEFNPFTQKNSVLLDIEKAVRMQRVFNDLVGALLIDTHSELKSAWGRLVKAKKAQDPSAIAAVAKMPVTEKEFLALSERWDNEVFRNQTINAWVAFAKNKYKSVK